MPARVPNLAAKGTAGSEPVFVWLTAAVTVIVLSPLAVFMIIADPPDADTVLLGGVLIISPAGGRGA